MKKIHRLALAFTAVWLFAGLAEAAPFNSFDPRSMGMGGVGVAVSNGNTAPLFNPALLATGQEENDVHLTIPAIGARVSDPDDFIDAVDDFQDADYIDTLSSSIDAVNNTNPSDLGSLSTQLRTVATDGDSLNDSLRTLDGKVIQGELGSAIIVGVPGKDFGYAFLGNSWLAAGGVVNYEDADDLAALVSDVTLVASCLDDPASCSQDTLDQLQWVTVTTNAQGDIVSVNGITYDPDQDVNSTVDIRGVALVEAGVSLAAGFSLMDKPVTLGVTPKYVAAKVFDYQANVDTADEDDFDADDYTADYNDFNLDVGASLEFAPGWRAGLVVKNLIAREYETMRRVNGVMTPTGNVVELNPQLRAGLSWQSDWYTLAADLDLAENEPAGLEEPSQYLALGAELNGWEWVQLRLGFRADLSNSDRSVASIGFGVSPSVFHLDFAVAGNGDEVGAAAQLGFQF